MNIPTNSHSHWAVFKCRRNIQVKDTFGFGPSFYGPRTTTKAPFKEEQKQKESKKRIFLGH